MSRPSYYAYILVPPRPSFATDQTESEAAVMAEHVAYWTSLLDQGIAVAFGPVLDPAGLWGLAVVEADAHALEDIRAHDPAVATGMATADIHPMPRAIARRAPDSHADH